MTQLTCGACHRPITTRYATNVWNIPFHTHHATCWSCQHPINNPRSATGTYCDGCNKTRILTQTDSLTRARNMRLLLEERLINVPAGTITFKLHDPPLVPGHNYLGTTHGLACTEPDGTVKATRVTVNIQRGLPAVHHDLVVAHELTHAWLRLHHATPTRIIEEGLAERTAHWILGQTAEPIALIHQQLIATNPDPTYGTGYRLIVHAEHQHGWPTLAHHILANNKLPPT